MPSIVKELIEECIKPHVGASLLVKKSIVIASRINDRSVQDWLMNELKGYEGDIPEYRKMRGDISFYNQYNGQIIPLIFKDSKISEIFKIRSNFQKISEIEKLLLTDNLQFQTAIPEKMAIGLIDQFDLPSKPFFIVDRMSIESIVESVKAKIFEWVVLLDQNEIVDDNMEFDEETKQKASTFIFNIKNMYSSQIQTGNVGSSSIKNTENNYNKELIDFLERVKKHKIIESWERKEEIKELESLIAKIEAYKDGVKNQDDEYANSILSLNRMAEGALSSASGAMLFGFIKMLSNAIP